MITIPFEIQTQLDELNFRGNHNLRPAGAIISYTDEMLAEYQKCKEDPIYFIENYCKIISLDDGLVLFKMYEYQRRVIRAYNDNRHCISLQPRQSGKTTTTAAFFTWYGIFHDEKTLVILANKDKISKEIMSRVKMMYEYLPKWLQQGIHTWNKGSVELENNTRIMSGATSSTGYRGFSVSMLYCDEMAFVPPNVVEEFYTAMYPTLSSGKNTKFIISSTPNGINMFSKMWKDSLENMSIFHPIEVTWDEHPNRDQKWLDEQLLALGELKMNQEILCQFLGSSLTLLRGSTLSSLTYDTPIEEPTDLYIGLKIYEYPIPHRVYSMTVDTSRGRHMDYSAFTIFDITEYPHTIAATYRNNEISPLMYANVCDTVGRRYNDSYMLVEINDIGGQVADTIYQDLEYEGEMFWTKSGDTLGAAGVEPYPGIRTTKKTKRIGCANLKDMIEAGQLLINDFHIISELSTFIQSANGTYAGDVGTNDDTVTTLWLHSWMCSQAWFGDLTDTNFRLKLHSQRVADMEEMLCLPIICDGLEDINSASEFDYFR